MQTISDYTIYCTEEQTKKALELGAPIKIDTIFESDHETSRDDKVHISKHLAKSAPYQEYATIPTAEQLIGWLESQDAIMEVHVGRASTEPKTNNWDFAIFVRKYYEVILGDASNYYDRREATLAAIDAALDYLSNK